MGPSRSERSGSNEPEIKMPNTQRQLITPRIARMLRELEGPPSEESGYAKAVVKRSEKAGRKRVMAHAVFMGGTVAKAH